MAFALCKCWGARWIHPTVTRWPACRPSICSLMRAVLRPWCGSNIANLNHKISRTQKVLVALTCKNDQSFRCARKRAHACSHTWCAFLHRKWPGGLVPQLLLGSQRQTAPPLGFSEVVPGAACHIRRTACSTSDQRPIPQRQTVRDDLDMPLFHMEINHFPF